MPVCVYVEKCPFFNDQMKDMPKTSDVIKDKYCRDKYEKCARYMIASTRGREAVPKDLFPHQGEIAREVLEKAA